MKDGPNRVTTLHVPRTRQNLQCMRTARADMLCRCSVGGLGLHAEAFPLARCCLPLTGADEALRLTTWDGLGTREKFKHRSTALRDTLCRCIFGGLVMHAPR